MRRKYKFKKSGILIIVLTALLIITVVCILLVKCEPDPLDNPSNKNVSTPSSESNPESQQSNPTSEVPPIEPIDTVLTTKKRSDWELILLNPVAPALEKELDIEKASFDGELVDSRAAQAYTDMCNAAKADGITLFLRSGYRTIALQQTYYDSNVQRYLGEGLTQEEAIERTLEYYAYPGKSEHHTGLAFDIITPEYQRDVYTLNEQFAQTDAYRWLVENSADYGFILRYPKDKVDITKINYEPWHYRYVGVESAQYITDNKLCLEEYLPLLGE